MSNNNIWYGFLEAGEKSSPVVRDLSLETDNAKTVYLYNFTRGIFLEYSREIVEPKLRALKTGDISQEELENAFKAARKTFNIGKTVNNLKVAATTTPPSTIMKTMISSWTWMAGMTSRMKTNRHLTVNA